jgi:hypothetical protein
VRHYRWAGGSRLRGHTVEMNDPGIEPLGRRVLGAEGPHQGRALPPRAPPEQPGQQADFF